MLKRYFGKLLCFLGAHKWEAYATHQWSQELLKEYTKKSEFAKYIIPTPRPGVEDSQCVRCKNVVQRLSLQAALRGWISDT